MKVLLKPTAHAKKIKPLANGSSPMLHSTKNRHAGKRVCACQPGRPDEFVKKIAKNVAPFHFLSKLVQHFFPRKKYFHTLKKLANVNNSPIDNLNLATLMSAHARWHVGKKI
jgi:hypothetical protein